MFKPILLTMLLGAASQGAQAACSLSKEIELNITVENDQILIPATIRGQEVKFLLETAYPANVMPSSAPARLGVPVTPLIPPEYIADRDTIKGSRENGLLASDGAGRADIPELYLDGKVMRGVTFAVFYTKDSFGLGDVVGALSSYIWRDYEVEIDVPHNLLTLYEAEDCSRTNLAYWGKDYNVVSLTESGIGAEFPIKLNGREVTAILDSGSPVSTVTDRTAAKVGIDRPSTASSIDAPPPVGVQSTDLPSLVRFTHGFGLDARSPNILSSNLNDLGPQTPKSYWSAGIDSLSIDQEVVSHVVMRVVPSPKISHEVGTRTPRNLTSYDVLLGVDFLKTHRVLISHKQHKLYFSYVGGPGFGKP